MHLQTQVHVFSVDNSLAAEHIPHVRSDARLLNLQDVQIHSMEILGIKGLFILLEGDCLLFDMPMQELYLMTRLI